MGEHEKCPKCHRKLRVETGGYQKANTSDGFRVALPDSLTCINCGYYKEIFKEEVVDKNMLNKNKYPAKRKAIGDAGWLQDLVNEQYTKIAALKARGNTWHKIGLALSKEDPRFKACSFSSIGNVWRRLAAER